MTNYRSAYGQALESAGYTVLECPKCDALSAARKGIAPYEGVDWHKSDCPMRKADAMDIAGEGC